MPRGRSRPRSYAPYRPRFLSFGTPTEMEVGELAQMIQKALPSMARMRFVNSGTEAVLSAIRVARAATQREKPG